MKHVLERLRRHALDGAKSGAGVMPALLLALLPGYALGAAAGASEGLEEVIVTATRRAESIRDVPLSVAAVSQEQMDVQGMRDIDDVAKYTPGVQFSRGGGFGADLDSGIAIRGITSNGVGGATTGIYIDDTPIQARSTAASGNFSSNAYPRLFDIERVEVLRGPQGTLFGSGAEGGAVRFITPEPSRTNWSSYVRSEVGFTQYGAPSYELGAAGGGPLVEDKVGFRASVWTRRDGGYVDRRSWYTNALQEKAANHTESASARLAVGFAPTENLVITPSLYWQRVDARGTGAFFMPNDPVLPFDIENLNHADMGNPSDGDFVDARNINQWAVQTITLPALKIDWQFGGVELVSNTSYYDRKQEGVTDFGFLDFGTWSYIFTGGNAAVYFPADPTWLAPGSDSQRNKFFTQEVRLQSTDANARFKWVVGAFYSKNKLIDNRTVRNPNVGQLIHDLAGFCEPDECLAMIFGVGQGPDGVIFGGGTTVHDDQKAVFGQADFRIVGGLTATAGLRYTKMDLDFLNLLDGPVNGPPIPRTERGAASDSAVTPKFGLSYKTEGGSLYYASAAKGFRSGGPRDPINAVSCIDVFQRIGINPSAGQYGPDSVWSYELGSKFTFADRLQVDVSVYQINWTDMIRNISPGQGCPLSVTANLGSARSRGVDLSLAYRATDALLLTLNAGIGEVKQTSTEGPIDEDGNRILDSEGRPILFTREGAWLFGSNTTVTAAAQYDFQVFSNDSYARLDYSYQGKGKKGDEWDPTMAVYAGANNLFEPVAIKEANLRLGTKFSGWDVSLFINNLTDERPFLGKGRLNTNAPIITATTLRPRTVGITAVYRR
jgi:outer membrane receptor protein involved in Fe transport